MKRMKPSIYAKDVKLYNLGTLKLTQTWKKNGTCPQGTIPIRRIAKDYRSTLLRKHRHPKFSDYKRSPNTLRSNNTRGEREYATIDVYGNFSGAQAKINLWNPSMETPGELSVSQIWVATGDGDDLNTIEARWCVGQDTVITRPDFLYYGQFCANILGSCHWLQFHGNIDFQRRPKRCHLRYSQGPK